MMCTHFLPSLRAGGSLFLKGRGSSYGCVELYGFPRPSPHPILPLTPWLGSWADMGTTQTQDVQAPGRPRSSEAQALHSCRGPSRPGTGAPGCPGQLRRV